MGEVLVFEGLRGWNKIHWKEKVLSGRRGMKTDNYTESELLWGKQCAEKDQEFVSLSGRPTIKG
jgi:hypothetical protein